MRPRPPSSADLTCPGCGAAFPAAARFCADCGLPLVGAEPAPHGNVSESHRRARKIKPQLSEGRLVRAAGARNLAEAEFIQGLLLEEGVPSMLRRSAGFDVPDFLAAGPRDVLVPQAALDTAHEVLLQAELVAPAPATRTRVSPGRLLAVLVLALALGALLVWLATLSVR